MNPRVLAIPLLFLALGALTTGCQSVKEHSFTGRLWDNGDLVDHFEPAPLAGVKLFRHGHDADFLVEYDEELESTGKTRRRAYFLLANERRIERREKPLFVPLNRAADMEPVPVQAHGDTNLTANVWAELSPKSDGFKLFRGGVADGPYILPVYVDKRSEAKRVLLTPITVTMDATVAGAIAGVVVWYALAESNATCP